MATLSIFDWLFLSSAAAFNLLIGGIFIAQKHGKNQWVNLLGRIWLFTSLPLLVVFVNDLIIGKPTWVLLCFVLVFVYILVEFLLDYVFNYPFREKWVTHVPYIILEYIALFSLIAIAIQIDQVLSWIVAVTFWIMMGSLIYLYAGRREQKTT